MKFNKDILQMDCEAVAEATCRFIQEQVTALRRDGVIVGLSGGVDSALCASLCVRALGKDKVVGLILPEKESDATSAQYAQKQARALGITTENVDVTPALEGFGAYAKRDKAITDIFPEYDSRYRSKIVLPPKLLSEDRLTFFKLIIERDGDTKSARLDNQGLRRIVAATNMKQRTRMTYLYYYAELNNYTVCGTTNKTETIQGFFVKYGDGGVDIEPIAPLYKVQVFQLAAFMGVIEEIRKRDPTPDTFSLHQTDEEFYFRIPFDDLDRLLYAWEYKVPVAEVCAALSLSEDQVKRAFRDFTSKYNTTKHLRALPPAPDA